MPGGGSDHALLDNRALVIRIATGFWVLTVALFAALGISAVADVVQVLDDAAYEFVVDAEIEVLVTIGKVLDVIGGPWVVTPLVFAITVYLAWRERWEAFTFWVSAMIISQLLVTSAKLLYARPRPPIPLVETSTHSFPSGHASAGAAVAIALVFVLVPAGRTRRKFEVLAGVFAVIMALSRVYLRAHWLSDVVAGAAMGTAVALSAALVVQAVWRRRARPV